MKILFWLSLGLIVYEYAGYPLLLWLVSKVRPRPIHRFIIEPSVSIIIAAYNEEANLAAKLENTLSMTYPAQKREIIVVSDGSTDRTESIARSYADSGVVCVALPERSGKSIALNEGVRLANGEILVFSDVGALADPDCLEKLTEDFADENVGCVSTEDRIVGQSNCGGEGAYVRYEMWLRQLESRTGSCVAVSGSFYAIREDLCPVFSPDAATDLLSVASTVRSGKRAISEPSAIARMATVATHGDEFQRKVRTVLTGISCLPSMLPLLNPFRYGFFSVELVSHKILRWVGGVFLITFFVSNLFLAEKSAVYTAAFALQMLAGVLCVAGLLIEGLVERNRLVRLLSFFYITKFSALVACWKYLTGARAAIWQPSRRVMEEISE